MEKQAIIARIVELSGAIQYHADLYYNKAKSEITDAEYDAMVDDLKTLVAELERIDPSAPEIGMGKEVLNNIGAVPSYGRKVTHSQKMGSLDKAISVAEVLAWYKKYATKGGKVAVMPKIDGCSGRFVFTDGTLTEAATRGDGNVGMSVLDNVRATKSIPKFIGNGKTVEVRAEVIMARSVFKNLTESGVKGANPRNLGTGSLMAQDPQETASRNLSIIAYDVIGAPRFKTEGAKRTWMAVNLPGIPLADMQVIDIEQFESLALEWEAKRPDLDYEIDGLVIALNSIDDQEEVGWDDAGKCPRGKIAFKFKPEQKTAKVTGIDWQVGRTGKLTPMARIEPTLLAGSTIRNITLHNLARVRELDVGIGDEILLQKAGDIIPECCRVTDRPESRDANVFVTKCPSCGGDVVMDEVVQPDGTVKNVNLWCVSQTCPAQLERRVLHWVKTLDILGVGQGIIGELCQLGFVKDVPDLYFLTEEQFMAATGGRSSAKKAQTAIMEKSDIPLSVFLDGLGIDGLGTTSSKLVAKEFQTLARVRIADVQEFDALPDIGLTTATKIVEGLKALSGMIDRLVETLDIQEVVMKQGPLTGMSFVQTGTLSIGRKEMENLISENGGENKGSVGKGLTYLIAADPNSGSAKNLKAQKLGVKVIGEAELRKMIG